MYTVEVAHHCKAWRNGDLEDEFKLEEMTNFKTRTAAKNYIMSKVKGKKVQQNWHKGNTPSYVL